MNGRNAQGTTSLLLFCFGQTGHGVAGPPEFEGADPLKVFVLEENLGTQA